VDRKKNMIQRAGGTVSVSEVEETLKPHGAVFDAAVAEGRPRRHHREARGAVPRAAVRIHGTGADRVSRELSAPFRRHDAEALLPIGAP
jgi:acyl-CoA synthetase (AMP-forming)/AMP-acid ligase II